MITAPDLMTRYHREVSDVTPRTEFVEARYSGGSPASWNSTSAATVSTASLNAASLAAAEGASSIE
jgi:hypothetical protein